MSDCCLTCCQRAQSWGYWRGWRGWSPGPRWRACCPPWARPPSARAPGLSGEKFRELEICLVRECHLNLLRLDSPGSVWPNTLAKLFSDTKGEESDWVWKLKPESKSQYEFYWFYVIKSMNQKYRQSELKIVVMTTKRNKKSSKKSYFSLQPSLINLLHPQRSRAERDMRAGIMQYMI